MDILFGTDITLPFEWLRIGLAVLGTAACAYYDLFNNKNVPERLLQAFLGLSLLVCIVAYDPIATPYGLVAGAILFIGNYILYKTGYLGGADVPILTAIALLLPSQPTALLLDKTTAWATFPFIIHVLTAAFLTFMLHLLAKTVPYAIKSLKPGAIKAEQWFGAFAIVISYGILAFVMSSMPLLGGAYIIFLALLAAVSVYFVLFRTAINDSMIEWVPAKKVQVEDIIAPDKMDAQTVKKYAIGRLVDEAEHKRLQQVKEKIPVYSGLLPFVPHLLLGLIISLLFGNILFVLAGIGGPVGF
ncbi:Uncharacterised protein [uncultured archaeon]|nr:Uncharacterised protein [uncultured archaeon]